MAKQKKAGTRRKSSRAQSKKTTARKLQQEDNNINTAMSTLDLNPTVPKPSLSTPTQPTRNPAPASNADPALPPNHNPNADPVNEGANTPANNAASWCRDAAEKLVRIGQRGIVMPAPVFMLARLLASSLYGVYRAMY